MVKSWLTLIMFCLCLAGISQVYADDSEDHTLINSSADDVVKDDSRVFHVYEGVDLISTLKFQYGKPRIVVKSVYPQLASDTDDDNVSLFNDLVMQTLQDEIAKFTSQVKERQPYQQKMSKTKYSNDLFIDYDTSYVKSKNEHIISIRFSIQGFIAGMAHPYHYHRSLNYNLDANQQIQLADLFIPNSDYLDVFSSYARTTLSRRLSNQLMVSDGTTAKPENFAIWNIKPNGILVTFDEYKVAPYVYGAQTVLIPYNALQEILAENSPIADCVKHQRRCISNNLLTGGFIDEARNTRHRSFNPILG